MVLPCMGQGLGFETANKITKVGKFTRLVPPDNIENIEQKSLLFHVHSSWWRHSILSYLLIIGLQSSSASHHPYVKCLIN
jgi:hypothetical protein